MVFKYKWKHHLLPKFTSQPAALDRLSFMAKNVEPVKHTGAQRCRVTVNFKICISVQENIGIYLPLWTRFVTESV